MPDDPWRDFYPESFDSPARALGNARALMLRPAGQPLFRFTEEEKIIMESANKPLMTQAARDKAAADSKASEMRAAEQKVAAEALATRVERDRADDRAMAERAETERKRLEAERVRIADAETASQRAAMRAPRVDLTNARAQAEMTRAEAGEKAIDPPLVAEAVRQSAMPSMAHPPRAALKLWTLRPKDRNEPPFFFVGTVQDYTVIASSEKHARAIAAGDSSVHFAAWKDEALTECVETDMTKPRVVARDMGI